MVTNADAKTPKEIDSIVVVARRGDSIVERIHGRGVEPERVVETAKTALTEAPRGALTDRPPDRDGIGFHQGNDGLVPSHRTNLSRLPDRAECGRR